MADCREKLLSALTNMLVENDIDVLEIRNKIVVILDDFEISERSTNIVVRDNTSDQLLKLYAGTLLTEGKSKKTVKQYIDLLQRFYRDTGKSFIDINTFDIRVWLAKIKQYTKSTTCQNYRSYLSAFYQWMLAEEIIEKNPMTKIKSIKCEENMKFPFSETEIDLLRKYCGTLRERAELEVLLSSGIRVSELCALDINDINFNTMEVFVKKAKGGKQRITYINELCLTHLKKYLDSRKDNNPCLFYSRNRRRVSRSTVQKDLAFIGERANVSNVHPHRCRRTFATSMAKKGCDITIIKTLMGHSDINTTMTYISLNVSHIRNQYQQYS